MAITFAEIKAAYGLIRDALILSPCLPSRSLSEITGARVALKFETLQYTGSFKERGAVVKIASLGPREKAAGVAALSAGNHAQAVAYHAHRLGIGTTIVMPQGTPRIKAQNTERLGANVVLHGESMEEAADALPMFVRCKRRFKDGKEHRYWSVAENVRVRGRRVVQRHVLYLGEINDSQRAAWCRSIEVVEGKSRSRQMALFPGDRDAPALTCEVVKIKVSEVSLHDPRQWGACWLALSLWGRLELDRFWSERLPPSRQGTHLTTRQSWSIQYLNMSSSFKARYVWVASRRWTYPFQSPPPRRGGFVAQVNGGLLAARSSGATIKRFT